MAQLRSPLIYLLGIAAAVAFAVWWFEGRGHEGLAGWPLDAIVILCVILLNATLGWMQDTKAAQAVAALAKMTTATSAVIRDGKVVRVSSTELVKGDVLVLSEGDAVGADARLIHAAALMVLEASLKNPAVLIDAVALGDRLNMVFKGTAIAQGSARAIVTATGMQTEMGGIATLLDSTPDAPTPLQIEIEYLGKVLGIAALIIATVVVVKVLLISDTLGRTDITGVGYEPEGRAELGGAVLASGTLRDELEAVIAVGSLAGNAQFQKDDVGTWTIQGDPTEAAFLVAQHKLGSIEVAPAIANRFKRLGEIPFTSQRKMMSVLVEDRLAGKGHLLFTKGAPDVLLAHCSHVRVGKNSVLLDQTLRTRLVADVDSMANDALRTLAVACRVLAPQEHVPAILPWRIALSE